MTGYFNKHIVLSSGKTEIQTQLEECQALIRLQHEYITHLEKGLDVMKGMAAYIEILESRLEELGLQVEGFQYPEEECSSTSVDAKV